jgi:hypothetical protein
MKNKKILKKETKELVFAKIANALADLKGGVNKKKFDKKLQKASSLLAKDIARASEKLTSKKAKVKKSKPEKLPKNAKMNSVKFNNLPSSVQAPAGSENIVP